MSYRMLKVNANLHQELSRLIVEEFSWDSVLVTLTQVMVISDLKSATAWISVSGSDKTEAVIDLLNKRSSGFYKLLSQRLKMKYVPHIVFKLDDRADAVSRIDELLEEVK